MKKEPCSTPAQPAVLLGMKKPAPCVRLTMPPKGKKKAAENEDNLGLPAEGSQPIRGPEDAIQRLKERTLLDRVSALYVCGRGGSCVVVVNSLSTLPDCCCQRVSPAASMLTVACGAERCKTGGYKAKTWS